MPGVRLFGDWDKLPEVLTLAARFQKSVDRSLLKEGHHLRGQIVTGVASGAPGGKPFAPLSPITLAIRRASGFGGGKPLNVSGALRGSVVVVKRGDGVFVGLLRQGGAQKLANVGAIHEFGATWTQRWTARSRRWFFAMLRKAGVPALSGPRRKGGAFRSQTGSVTITIPARPFIGPVWEKERAGIAKRFWTNVGEGMGGDFVQR
jgi:hypothetical protein